jgi:hypothetical protein
MKTLTNAEDKAEIVQRLETIGPESRRRWGKMTVGEMICHLSDAFRVTKREREAKSISTWFKRSVMKWAALELPVQWPHGVSTVGECEAGRGGTPPAEIESDLRELTKLLERFTRQPREFEYSDHPIFGKMSDKEWQRWGYLHVDHHLRQFGA